MNEETINPCEDPIPQEETSLGTPAIGYIGYLVGVLYVGKGFVLFHAESAGMPDYLEAVIYFFLLWLAGPTLAAMLAMLISRSHYVWGFYILLSSILGVVSFTSFADNGIGGVAFVFVVPALQWLGFVILLVVTAVIRARRRGVSLIRFLLFGTSGEWR